VDDGILRGGGFLLEGRHGELLFKKEDSKMLQTADNYEWKLERKTNMSLMKFLRLDVCWSSWLMIRSDRRFSLP
jgi:hypothetical protein